MSKEKILIWGSKSQARLVCHMVRQIHKGCIEITGIYDPSADKLSFESDIPFYNTTTGLHNLCKISTAFLVCIGGENGKARVNISNTLTRKGLNSFNILSEHALIDDTVQFDSGLLAMPGTLVHKFVTIGKQCILNSSCTVDHECELGDGVHIMGGACVAGRVKIGNYSTIGTNATILPDIHIGKNVIIGAGAVVTKDVEDNCVMVGIPARFLRKNTNRD